MNKLVPFFLSAALIALGALFIFSSYNERNKTISSIDQLFAARINTVASLASLSIKEAIVSTSLLYEMHEERLLDAASILLVFKDEPEITLSLLKQLDIIVHLVEQENGSIDGYWGPVPEEKRISFLQWASNKDMYVVAEDNIARELNLICMPHLMDNQWAVSCQDGASLNFFKQKTGIGPLLDSLIEQKFLYVVLQDHEGVLAAAPEKIDISSWGADGKLQEVLDDGIFYSRINQNSAPSYFEGLLPFDMPDGTEVILRLAIDATSLLQIIEDTKNRFEAVTILTFLLVLILILIIIFIWRIKAQKEQEALAFASQKEQNHYFEMIGQLAATVAHEIRNPLNTISMVVNRLGKEFTPTGKSVQEYDEILSVLSNEVNKTNSIVTDFLELGKPLELEYEKVNLAKLISEITLPSSIRAEAEKKQFEVINNCTCFALIDIRRLSQVLSNLTDNAFDEIHEGGKVLLIANEVEQNLHIQILDDGPGMTEEEIEKARQPFVSSKAAGTGLGLSIVSRLILAMGGKFVLSANEKKGLKAELFIPLTRKKF